MKLYNEGEEHPKVVDITKMMLGCGTVGKYGSSLLIIVSSRTIVWLFMLLL